MYILMDLLCVYNTEIQAKCIKSGHTLFAVRTNSPEAGHLTVQSSPPVFLVQKMC
jgi:hypothetical protein